MRYIVLVMLFFALPVAAAPVQEVKSAGGITAWLVEDASVPAFSLKLVVRHAGSAYDPADKEGLASLTAGLLTEGAGKRDGKAFQEALDYHAIRLNVGVDKDDLGVSLTSLSEHAEEAVCLMGDALIRPRFDENSILRMVAEQQAAIRQNASNPEYQASKLFDETVFAKHPYRRPTDGTQESVARITPEDITGYAANHLRRGELVVSVAGDISAERLRFLLDTCLDSLPEGMAEAAPLPEAADFAPGEKAQTMDVPQTVVQFALPGIARRDAQYYAAYTMNYLLGGNALSSRLGKEIREKRGLAYYAGSSLADYDRAALLIGNFATRSEEAAQAEQALREELARAADAGFTQDEFDRAMDYITGAFPAQIASNRSVVAYLDVMQRYGLGMDYLEKRNALMRGVTLDQVNVLAKTLLKNEKLLIISVGNHKNNKN